MRRLICLAAAALLLSSSLATAQLPDPPSEDQVRDLVERFRLMAAGNTRVETRERIAGYISEAPGTPDDLPRLTHHGGTLLVVRGYPWEGLWCLARSAQADWVHPDTLSNIGFALIFVDRHSEAERILLYTTDRWPEFLPAWTNLARVYLDAGRDDLAEIALDRADEIDPGSVVKEEARGRWAMQRGDVRAAADALVNLSALDPGNARIEQLLEFVPEHAIEAALAERLARVPMPAHFIRLEEPIDSYQDLVLDEVHRLYWWSTVEVYTRLSTTIDYAMTTLPPEVWEQLPPDIQATLIALGQGPGEALAVPNPAHAREHYPFLTMALQRWQDNYLAQMQAIYRDGEVGRILREEQERQQGYHQEMMAALNAGDTLGEAMDPYLHRCITSLEGSHPGWLTAMATARERGNHVTRRHWLITAALISMLPPELQADELQYLHKQVALSNLNHSGEVSKWIGLGRMAVLMDREAAFIAADALHEAAAAREREAQMAREGIEEDWDDDLLPLPWLLREVPELTGSTWGGVNLGVFAVKITAGQIGVSGGEGLVGETSFNWERMELEMGIGYGVATPPLGPTPFAGGVGGSGKVLGVLRISETDGVRIGVRDNAQISVGTLFFGQDIDVVNHYHWIASSGS